MSLKKQNHLTKSWVWVCVLLCVSLTCRVLQTKSLLSSPHTLWAATTNTITRNTKTMDNQILPKAVEYLFTPLTRLSSPDQFITAAVLVQEIDTSEPCTTEQREKNTHTCYLQPQPQEKTQIFLSDGFISFSNGFDLNMFHFCPLCQAEPTFCSSPQMTRCNTMSFTISSCTQTQHALTCLVHTNVTVNGEKLTFKNTTCVQFNAVRKSR